MFKNLKKIEKMASEQTENKLQKEQAEVDNSNQEQISKQQKELEDTFEQLFDVENFFKGSLIAGTGLFVMLFMFAVTFDNEMYQKKY